MPPGAGAAFEEKTLSNAHPIPSLPAPAPRSPLRAKLQSLQGPREPGQPPGGLRWACPELPGALGLTRSTPFVPLANCLPWTELEPGAVFCV